MVRGSRDDPSSLDLPGWLQKVRSRTPARLLVGRAGSSYRTETQIELRDAHAAARDAVRMEFKLESAFGSAFVDQWGLFEVCTRANSKDAYLLRPDLGRHFSEEAREQVTQRCSASADLQVVIGDGLSVSAVATQVPPLLPLLQEGAKALGWTFGQPFAIRHCRVGVLNEVGILLAPRVAILLIGERPGLATSESLSAYMAYRPRPDDSDANRNLISNIHPRGVALPDAANRILKLATQMVSAESSGYVVREG